MLGDYEVSEFDLDSDIDEIEFEDLIEQEHDSKKDEGSYLNVNAEHMKKISRWHIRFNIAFQVTGLILLILVYFLAGLIVFDNVSTPECPWTAKESEIYPLGF